MSTATLQDAIEKSHDIAANAVADIKSHAPEMTSDLGEYRDDAVSAAKTVYAGGRRQAQRLANGAEHAYDAAKDCTLSTMRSAKSHPVTTVAIAAGVGLLVGAFLMWRR